MKHSRAAVSQSYTIQLVSVVVVLLPLLLALVWGKYFADDVYKALRLAREIATSTEGSFATTALNSPVFTLGLSIPARIGIEPAWPALVLSALGWSAAALAILAIGQSMNRFRGAVVTALLISFNPAIISTLGSSTSWIIALGWLALALLLRRRFVSAVPTFFLFIALIIPWPLNSDWSHINQYFAAVAWSIFLFAAGVGLDWFAGQLVNRDRARLPYPQLATILLAAVFIFVGAWQGVRIWQMFQDRTVFMRQLEGDVAAWLQAKTDTAATLMAGERIGYLAGRPFTSLPDSPQLETAKAIQAHLKDRPVDYLITGNELASQQLQNLVWFRLAYEPVQQFDSPYLPQAPFTIWAYRQPAADLGQRHTINARVPDRLWIIGYQIGPQEVSAGESVQMALYIEAPEATLEAVTPYQAIVRLISPTDSSTVREWIIDLPRTVSPKDWQAGKVMIEQFSLQMPDELEAGAYLLNLSLLGPESDELWPFSLDNDINRLDRIPTGSLIVPAAEKLAGIQPVAALFGEAIHLNGYISSEDAAGKTLDVKLEWTVDQVIDEDYVVFVHLIDSSGQLAASHDGIPGNGRFPTRAWQPGINIPDAHSILLPPDLAAGAYELKVGLYESDSGQRLSAETADGTVVEDSSILLTTIDRP